MRPWVLLFATACGDPHTPNLADPLCARAETAVYTAGPDECIRLKALNSQATFDAHGESCSGATCVYLRPGETAVVTGSIGPDAARWEAIRGLCEYQPPPADLPVPECP